MAGSRLPKFYWWVILRELRPLTQVIYLSGFLGADQLLDDTLSLAQGLIVVKTLGDFLLE